MKLHVPALLGACALLGGCGPVADNASNIPRLGQWQRESKLLALVANDVWIDRKDAPFSLPPDSTETKDCFEPTLKSGKEVNSDLLANSQQMCRLETFEENEGKLVSKGTCGPSEKGSNTITGTIEFDGREREESAEATVGVAMIVRGKDGASERVRIAYRTKWTRLGECRK